jgi:CRISPR system Cascade subunit CasE
MTRKTVLSRARLKRNAPIAALARELVPEDPANRVATAHRLVWTLFSDGPDRERDFLWREASPGEFYFLSDRAPNDVHGMFDVDPPKEFLPDLEAGQRLHFVLRANATVAKTSEAFRTAVRDPALKARRKAVRHDVVMNAIKDLSGPDRAAARREAVQRAGADWLSKKLQASGAEAVSDTIVVDGYSVLRPARARNSGGMSIGILDFTGSLVVRDPSAFLDTVSQGFGRAKAFGCGLMLIKRA